MSKCKRCGEVKDFNGCKVVNCQMRKEWKQDGDLGSIQEMQDRLRPSKHKPVIYYVVDGGAYCIECKSFLGMICDPYSSNVCGKCND